MKYINLLHSLKINKRLRLMMVLETLLLTVCYVFIAGGYNHIERQKTYDSITRLNNTLMAEMDHAVNTLDSIDKYPYVSIPYQVSNSIWDYLINPSRLLDDKSGFNVLFTEMYYKLNLLFPQLDSIFLYTYDGELLSFLNNDMTGNKLTPIQDISQSQWYQETIEKNGLLCLYNHNGLVETGYEPRPQTLFASRSLSYVTLPKPAGVIISGLNVSGITTHFSNNRIFPTQSFAIFDGNGRLLLASDGYEPGDAEGTEMAAYTANTSAFHYSVVSNTKKTAFCVIRTDRRDIFTANLPADLILFLLIPFVLLANLLLTSTIVQSINKPLNRMVDACKRLSLGDFSTRIDYKGTDEMAILTDSFNQMAEQVQHLITQVYQKSLAEKDLELQMLRSQINPHFLYNTLDSMRMAALIEGYDSHARMCELLAKILRYGVTESNRLVTVEDELHHLQDYIELIGLRFGNVIHFSIMIDPSIHSYSIIRLLLQPLVENSINHGIKDSLETGQIQIWGFKKENTLVFTVSDNGAGMDESALGLLRDYIDNKNQAFKSIGLKNIQRRIQLNYGEAYGLTIQSRLYSGTSVTVTVPIQEEEVYL